MTQRICIAHSNALTAGKTYFVKPKCIGFVMAHNDKGVWEIYPERVFEGGEKK